MSSATEPGIPQMAAAAVRWFVRGVGPQGAERGPLHELVSVGPNEWRFGWVRPLRVLRVSQSEPPMPHGGILADRHTTVPETIPSVKADKPWWVLVEFWWRAGAVRIQYPGLKEGLFGRSYELNGADWVLDRAVVPSTVQPDPGAETWGQAQGAHAAAAVKSASSALGKVVEGGFGLGILALIYLISKKL